MNAGVSLTHGHRQVRIGLIVLKHDVELRIKLFDPCEFKRQGFNFATNNGPLNVRRRKHHLARTRVKIAWILEIVRQTIAKVLCFTDIDNSTVFIGKTIDAR
ncbi:Uncharacterised protein [Chlamydia trachomatis]|nr:Uncharacterised protein [Chlamydia trachomatis]